MTVVLDTKISDTLSKFNQINSVSKAAKVFYLWTSAIEDDKLSTDKIFIHMYYVYWHGKGILGIGICIAKTGIIF